MKFIIISLCLFAIIEGRYELIFFSNSFTSELKKCAIYGVILVTIIPLDLTKETTKFITCPLEILILLIS